MIESRWQTKIHFIKLFLSLQLFLHIKGSKSDKPYSTASTSVNILRQQQGALVPATTEGQALKEAQNRYKLLQADYRTLHEKRLQDVSYE